MVQATKVSNKSGDFPLQSVFLIFRGLFLAGGGGESGGASIRNEAFIREGRLFQTLHHTRGV